MKLYRRQGYVALHHAAQALAAALPGPASFERELDHAATTIGGAAVGALIGHQWSGSVFFLPAGAFCCGVAALTCVLIAEKARLFRKRVHTQY